MSTTCHANAASTLVLVEAQSESIGERIARRRKALGISGAELARRARIHRNSVGKIERGGDSDLAAKVEAVLTQLEHEAGMDTPDMVTSTITLADGTTVMFAGTPDAVADTARKYLAEHRQ